MKKIFLLLMFIISCNNQNPMTNDEIVKAIESCYARDLVPYIVVGKFNYKNVYRVDCREKSWTQVLRERRWE